MLRLEEYFTSIADFNDNYYATTTNISTNITFFNKNLTTAYSFNWPYAVNPGEIEPAGTNIIYDPVNNFFFANRIAGGYFDVARFNGDKPWESPAVQRTIFFGPYYEANRVYWTQTDNYIIGHADFINISYSNPYGSSLKINKLNLVPSLVNNGFPYQGDSAAKAYSLINFVSDGTAIFYLGKNTNNNSIITKVNMNNNGLAATFYGHDEAASIAYFNNHLYYVNGGVGLVPRGITKVSAVTGLTVATSDIIPDIGVAIFCSIEGELWIFGGKEIFVMDENLNIIEVFEDSSASPNQLRVSVGSDEYSIYFWQPIAYPASFYNYLPINWMNRIQNNKFMFRGTATATAYSSTSLTGSFLIGAGGGWSVGRIGV